MAACERRGIALIELVAPTTPEERMAKIASGARGFIYAVGVTGTTGERAAPAPNSRTCSRAPRPRVRAGGGRIRDRRAGEGRGRGRSRGRRRDHRQPAGQGRRRGFRSRRRRRRLVRAFADALTALASRAHGTDPHRHRRAVYLDRALGDDIFGGFDSILIGIVMVLIAIASGSCSRSCPAGGADSHSRARQPAGTQPSARRLRGARGGDRGLQRGRLVRADADRQDARGLRQRAASLASDAEAQDVVDAERLAFQQLRGQATASS